MHFFLKKVLLIHNYTLNDLRAYRYVRYVKGQPGTREGWSETTATAAAISSPSPLSLLLDSEKKERKREC